MAKNQNTIFISYSHKDKKYLESFRSHFTTIRKDFKIWDDNMIKPGQKWKVEIGKALKTSVVGVLFLSADFLSSKFIMEEELPYIYILESAKIR